MNIHDKKFKWIDSSGMGEVDKNTIFHYRQQGELVWATYQGGSVRIGTISGRFKGRDQMEFDYQHLNARNEFRRGHCNSTLRLLENGKIELSEKWTWDQGGSGESILEEI